MTFHEKMYSDEQLSYLVRQVNQVKSLDGMIVEIGCWEGKSTIAIANACYPEMVTAVDHWKGNEDESPNHPSVQKAIDRDVFADFLVNIQEHTKGNVVPRISDCYSYLRFMQTARYKLKFCHIDASHDYDSVRLTIELLQPLLVPGAILCGDDYTTAHAGRADLKGGVQKAVRDTLPTHGHQKNFWFYEHRP
jgi:hypothetical protein